LDESVERAFSLFVKDLESRGVWLPSGWEVIDPGPAELTRRSALPRRWEWARESGWLWLVAKWDSAVE